MAANDFNHNATISYDVEQTSLSTRVHALQEAVNYVVGIPTIGGVTATTRDTVKIAEKFEEYLKTGTIS